MDVPPESVLQFVEEMSELAAQGEATQVILAFLGQALSDNGLLKGMD